MLSYTYEYMGDTIIKLPFRGWFLERTCLVMLGMVLNCQTHKVAVTRQDAGVGWTRCPDLLTSSTSAKCGMMMDHGHFMLPSLAPPHLKISASVHQQVIHFFLEKPAYHHKPVLGDHTSTRPLGKGVCDLQLNQHHGRICGWTMIRTYIYPDVSVYIYI